MPIPSAISTFCKDHAAEQCREAYWMSWIERLHLWVLVRCVVPSLSLYLILASSKHDYRVWKSCMKALLCAVVLQCVCRGWVILSGLQGACARELPFLVKC